MCGIWASVGWDPSNNRRRAQAGLDAAALRGPDGQELFEIATPCGPLFLGHRRLAVYDPSPRANQPMVRGPLTAVFNGALYDFKDLRNQLSREGASFQTDSDTEVLLEAWLRWGPTCVTRFDGMFAALVYDARSFSLHMARDRFGEKPLHLIESSAGFAAASEINQFSNAGMLTDTVPNMAVVCDFLDLGQAEAGCGTFYKGVTRLASGSHGGWDLSGGKPRVLPVISLFSRATTINPKLTDPQAASEALRDALKLSVARRMVADVKVGSCLSGGLDSTAIVRLAAMGDQEGVTLECICAVFDETAPNGQDLSERKYAQAAADHAGINLHIITPTGEAIRDSIASICSRQGEPFAHSSIAVQHAVFAAAHEAGIVVMLDGQGADELFGGYSGMLGARLADILTQEGLGAWQRAVIAFSAEGADLDEAALKRATFNALVPERARRGLAGLRGRWPRPEQVTRRVMSYEPGRRAGLNRFESLIAALTTQRSLPGLLRYEDRNAMTFGIETRLPFLSREVANLAEAMPGSAKANSGWTKAVLRDAMAGIVPDIVARRRRKLGFVSPHDRWMAGPLKSWALDGIDLAERAFGDALVLPAVGAIKTGIGNNMNANMSGFRLASLGHWAANNHVSS